jgi:hypothetical protein
VERIDVERLGYPQGGVEGGGIGQPIFLPARNHFFGLEYPQGHNDWTGVITLSHYPGKAVEDGLGSKSAVWGVAPDGEVKREFLNTYVPSFAVHYPSEPFVSFNEAFNTGYSTNEAIAMQSIAALKRDLMEAGVKVDSYSVTQWEDYASIWQPSPELYPCGFAPVQRAAERAGMGFGLWISLTGDVLDTHWGIAHGIGAARADEVSGPYCMDDAGYQGALKASLRQYLVENHINFLWCDYNQFSCPAHGYPAGSAVALEAGVDGYINVLEFVHKTSPGTRIEITTGMWLSPWWLRYADWVWLGGSDIDYMTASGVPSLEEKVREEPPHDTKRQAEITYRDSVIWDDFHKQHDVFPTWGLKTHGFYNWDMIGGAPDTQAGIEGNPVCCDEPLAQWADHVVTTLLRGISDWNLLLNLRFMTAEKWAYLVKALKWGRANWEVLSTTQMILGNPSKLEVYGYTHFHGDRGLILVRNPRDKEQSAEITLSSETGFWHMPPTQLKAQQVYPCEQLVPRVYGSGSRLTFELAPYESKVIELAEHPSRDDRIAIRACQESTR